MNDVLPNYCPSYQQAPVFPNICLVYRLHQLKFGSTTFRIALGTGHTNRQSLYHLTADLLTGTINAGRLSNVLVYTVTYLYLLSVSGVSTSVFRICLHAIYMLLAMHFKKK